MNFTKQLKSAPFPSGFYSICGAQGAGKTSLATALLRTDYKRWRKWRTEQGKALARRFYSESGVRLNISDRLYFSNVKILLDRRKNLYTHEVDIQRLGLPNDNYAVQYLPRGSVVFIQEADVLAYCRDWSSLNEYLKNLMKYVRHNLLTIIFDMQVGGDLDAALRKLSVGKFYVVKSCIKRFLLFWKQQKWKFLYIQSQLNAVVKEFAELGVNIKIPVVEWGSFRVWGHVFDCYPSFSGIPYFLYGIEKVGYEYREHPDGDLSIEGIKRYVAAHPLERPEEMKKSFKPDSSLKDKPKVQEEYNPF